MKKEFNVGDLVWAKLDGHPWWPSIIYDEALTSTEAQQAKKEGFMLVSFFGDNSYKWLDTKKILHFESNYSIYANRSSSRLFKKAVDEAVYEVNHRAALGLTCPCLFFSAYRSATVEGFLEVDIAGYKSGGVYTVQQIKGFRQEFQPVETLSFVQLLGFNSVNVPQDLNHLKEVARVLSFRKAKYAEVDEPYFHAFGVDPGDPNMTSKTALVQAPSDHPSVAEIDSQKKTTVKYQNKKIRCRATQEDKEDANKTKRMVKTNTRYDSNRKISQDHLPLKKRRAKVEVEQKPDFISANDDKKAESSATPTKCDDIQSFEKVHSPDNSMPSKAENIQSTETTVPSKTHCKQKNTPPASKPLEKRRQMQRHLKIGESSSMIKTPQEGPKMILSMKFPPNAALPSAAELKAKFAKFGQIDISGTQVSYGKSRCQVMFMNKSDAEKAYEQAVKFKKMFGQTNVSYSLCPKGSKSITEATAGSNLQPESPLRPHSVSVCGTERLYPNIYAKYREQADRTRVHANQGRVDISEKMLYLLNECSRIVVELKKCR